MQVQKITRLLKYEFKEDELKEMSDTVFKNIGTVNQLHGEKKASNASFGAKIKGLEEMNSEYAELIQAGHEERSIACEVTMNKPKDGIKTIVRLDTNESWEEPMTQHENTIDNLPLPDGVNDGSNDEDETDEEE